MRSARAGALVCLWLLLPSCVRGWNASSSSDVVWPVQTDSRLAHDLAHADKRIADSLVRDLADSAVTDGSCGPVASAQCWDVWAVFAKTDWEYYPLQIFGQTVVDNQKVYALFDGTEDDTYAEPSFYCTTWAAPYTGNRARTWDIERKKVDTHTYRILVRGISDTDCSKGQPVCAGEIHLNAARGWKIAQTVQCTYSTDNSGHGVTLPTWCTVDPGQGSISWQSGTDCGGCCACPDGAPVSIEVVVSN
jgi:hypothetical protein